MYVDGNTMIVDYLLVACLFELNFLGKEVDCIEC